jgi:hypothetical protein
MLASVLRRKEQFGLLTETLHKLASSARRASSTADEKTEKQALINTGLRKLDVPHDTKSILQQRIGLSDERAQIHDGKLRWISGSRTRSASSKADAPKPAWYTLGGIRNFIVSEIR